MAKSARKTSTRKRAATKRAGMKRAGTKRAGTKRAAMKRSAKRGASKRAAAKRGATARPARKRGAAKRATTKGGGSRRAGATARSASKRTGRTASAARQATPRAQGRGRSAATSGRGRPAATRLWIDAPGQHAERPGQTLATRNHDVIRQWAEERGAQPATVSGSRYDGRPGVLRFDFPGYGGSNLEQIGWDEWFGSFDERNVIFVFQEQKRDGQQSNFFRLDNPEREDA